MVKPTKVLAGVLIVLAVAIAGYLWSRSPVFTRAIYLIIGLVLASWLIASRAFNRLQVNRYSRGNKGELGQVFEEVYELANRSKLSKLWLEVEDGSKLPGSGGKRVLSTIRANTNRNFSSYTMLSRRGQFYLGPTRLVAGDPFGLFRAVKEFAGSQSLIVLPHLYRLDQFPGPLGMLQGGHISRRKTPESVPPNVTGIREHRPGDPLNRIHWPTTARRDRLMVKEFEQDPHSDVWLILDAHSLTNVDHDEDTTTVLETIPLWWLQKNEYQLPKSTFEYGASIAGSLARYYTSREQMLGFITSAQKRLVIPMDRGERQQLKILETLAFVEPVGKVPISAVIDSHLKFIQRGSSVIIITATAHQALLTAIASLLRQAISPLVILMDTTSFGAQWQNQEVYASLLAWKIPTIRIEYGDDLGAKLQKSSINAYSRQGWS